MQAYVTACKLMELRASLCRASLCNYMQAHGPAFKLMDLDAFLNILHAFLNILNAFWKILEHSECIL